MNKYNVGLKFVLVGIGLGYAQKSAIANGLLPPEITQSPPQDHLGQLGNVLTLFPEQSDIGQPKDSGTVGAGSQLYLPIPDSGMPPTPNPTQRGYCINKKAVPLFRGVIPVVGDEVIADTAASEISLWFYIPENDAIRAEFSILSDGDDFSVLGVENKTDFLEHYEEIYDISSRQGFVQIKLPKNALEVGKQYWWDLTLVCDEKDNSANVYIYGSVRRQASSQLRLDTQATTLAALKDALLRSDSALTLSDRQALGAALSDGGQPQTLIWVEDRLKAHYQVLWQRYNQLGQEMDAILATPVNLDRVKLHRLNQERSRIAFELAQLSPFFGLWGDAVDLLATYRADYPQAWQQLLNTIFQDDQFWLEENQGHE
ncbi:protein of unknown function DUF928 [[Leptolyngbya] sp. PCC 7376]|uniref:DUF928 domain-containing protein n=1 Tax=[Leptolyngbya] sp. PCC 7376 TaxID=111781 RepID=UPI00029F0695|nr:DUF928 domain-containing protein [[Leptolyngbya] sp. PCC 7376]AFY39255.1 protein of unknown function DUF928 [[Leptolyngbya] sp. PCC 7376]